MVGQRFSGALADETSFQIKADAFNVMNHSIGDNQAPVSMQLLRGTIRMVLALLTLLEACAICTWRLTSGSERLLGAVHLSL